MKKLLLIFTMIFVYGLLVSTANVVTTNSDKSKITVVSEKDQNATVELNKKEAKKAKGVKAESNSENCSKKEAKAGECTSDKAKTTSDCCKK